MTPELLGTLRVAMKFVMSWLSWELCLKMPVVKQLGDVSSTMLITNASSVVASTASTVSLNTLAFSVSKNSVVTDDQTTYSRRCFS